MSRRYVTWIDGEEATVELVSNDDSGHVVARIEADDGEVREVALDVARGDSARISVRDGAGAMRHALVTADGRNVGCAFGFDAVGVRVMSERDAWAGAGQDEAGEGAVTVAMPGRVVKLLVTTGDVVERGAPVLIIEAMKMENEVKAPRDGVVLAVNVAEGDSVEADLVLLEIGDADEGDA